MTAPRVKLDIDATREKLAALGLSHAVEALEGLLSDAVRSEMPAHVFLERLLDAERSGREERRVRTMLKTAKIPTGATLENFDFAFQPAIERSRIETLATGAWIRGGEVVLMQGPPGVGKSHLLCGLGIRAIQLGFSVQYFRFDELLTALRADAHLPPARLKSRKYMSSALLLVDEMGYDPMSRNDASVRRGGRPLEGRLARLTLPPRQLSLWPRRHDHHDQQEHPRLDRTACRRRGAGNGYPRPAPPPCPCPQHQGPQLQAARSRGSPEGLTIPTPAPTPPRLRRARSDS